MPSRSRRGQKRGGPQPQAPPPAPAAEPTTPSSGPGGEHDTPVPRDFGRDGISGLVTHDRALRAREVSRPRSADEADAIAGAEAMLRRLGPRKRS